MNYLLSFAEHSLPSEKLQMSSKISNEILEMKLGFNILYILFLYFTFSRGFETWIIKQIIFFRIR